MLDLSRCLLAALSAWVLAGLLILMLIRLAHAQALLDLPGGRKQHALPTPTWGGVAIFFSLFASLVYWQEIDQIPQMHSAFLGMGILFLMGLQDDHQALSPFHKLGMQGLAGLLVALSDLRIMWLPFGGETWVLPVWAQICITVLVLVSLINAFNFIDGIDGLAGGLAVIAALVMGFLFLWLHQVSYAMLAFILAGSVLGFLRYNAHAARIFLGDAGSLSVGFLLGVLSLRLWQAPPGALPSVSIPLLILSIWVVPGVDLIQVVLRRLYQKRSPFRPDRSCKLP